MVQAKQQGEYPADWVQIAHEIKKAAGWHCVRCGVEHDPDTRSGHCLTVHHLTGDKSDCRWFNLACLCQRCHLQIQHKVVMERIWLLEHSEWFKPFLGGWAAWYYLGLELTREQVMENLDFYADLQRRVTQGEEPCQLLAFVNFAANHSHVRLEVSDVVKVSIVAPDANVTPASE